MKYCGLIFWPIKTNIRRNTGYRLRKKFVKYTEKIHISEHTYKLYYVIMNSSDVCEQECFSERFFQFFIL